MNYKQTCQAIQKDISDGIARNKKAKEEKVKELKDDRGDDSGKYERELMRGGE